MSSSPALSSFALNPAVWRMPPVTSSGGMHPLPPPAATIAMRGDVSVGGKVARSLGRVLIEQMKDLLGV